MATTVDTPTRPPRQLGRTGRHADATRKSAAREARIDATAEAEEAGKATDRMRKRGGLRTATAVTERILPGVDCLRDSDTTDHNGVYRELGSTHIAARWRFEKSADPHVFGSLPQISDETSPIATPLHSDATATHPRNALNIGGAAVRADSSIALAVVRCSRC